MLPKYKAWLARCRSQIERAESEPSAAIVDVAPEAPRAAAAPRTGLKNLGNTCYMNSVVQLLVHCDAFRGFFLDFIKQQAPLALGPVGIKREATITSLEDEAERRAEARFAEWKEAKMKSLAEREESAERIGAETARGEASLRARRDAF